MSKQRDREGERESNRVHANPDEKDLATLQTNQNMINSPPIPREREREERERERQREREGQRERKRQRENSSHKSNAS